MSRGPGWWYKLRRECYGGQKQWQAKVPLGELVSRPIVAEGRRKARVEWSRGEEEARRFLTMVDRLGDRAPVYRALMREGERWGVVVSAFWGCGLKLTDGELWERGYVEASGGGGYRITRKGMRAIYRSW